ncbi:HAD-IC family P-type ATPase [Streptomyces sp. NPDC005917]|uniref:HAD-IC family P-type ATPase n=1 Tax=unclassified Streptomyces TaxID=2593676 RepID=UPI0033E43501
MLRSDVVVSLGRWFVAEASAAAASSAGVITLHAVRAPVEVLRAVEWGRQTAERVGGAVSGEVARAAEVVRDAGPVRGRRRVWSRPGRAHIEVRGLVGRGETQERLAGGLEPALAGVAGVRWVRVNAALGHVVVDAVEEDFSLDELLDVVRAVEQSHGAAEHPFTQDRPGAAFDDVPEVLARVALVSDCVGLLGALAGLMASAARLPRLVRVPLVVADTQPQMRRWLVRQVGRAHADTFLTMAGAVVYSATGGTTPLALDAIQQWWRLGEARSRRAVWELRERELVAGGAGLPRQAVTSLPRPAAMPAGPVEKCAERTSLAALLGAAGVATWTRNAEHAGQAVLATVPKAARAGREAFCALLGRDLAQAGVVPMNPGALRLLDRVSAVVIGSGALCLPRVRLLSVAAGEEQDEAVLWEAAQKVLTGRTLREMSGPGPWTAGGRQLRRQPGAVGQQPDSAPGMHLEVRDADGRLLGRVVVGCELDPLADAVITAARSGGRRLELTQHASAAELLRWADCAVPAAGTMAERVRTLQSDGHVVALVTCCDGEALSAADVGIAFPPPADTGEPAPGALWSADVVCGTGLEHVWRVLSALDEARQVSAASARLSMGGSALGALIAAAGARHSTWGLTASPVYGAAFLAQVGAARAARRLARQPLPAGRIRGAWHAMDAHDAFHILRQLRRGAEEQQTTASVAAPTALERIGDRLAAAVGWAVTSLGLTVQAQHGVELLDAVREELRDPLTPVLALGAAASAAVGSGVDSLLVGGVMVGNAVISGAQRMRAEQALKTLLANETITAHRVCWTPDDDQTSADSQRFPGLQETADLDAVDASRLQVGDLIRLRPSEVVPADARLLASERLEVDEAALTGEPIAVAKTPAATPGADLAERSCMVYQGCTVLAGTGLAIVVATGEQTEAGRAADLAGGATTASGIEGHLAALTKAALPVVGIGGAAVTALGLLRGVPLRQALSSGVAVAVAAVPEGLPLVATVAQSAAARRLSRYGVLPRSARVLEALGRVDVICFDKTGTLTEGRLTLTRLASPEEILPSDRPQAHRLLRAAARACPATDAPPAHATDRAVLEAAATYEIEDPAWVQDVELPFEASRGYSASLGTENGRRVLSVKGAPEIILRRCSTTFDTDTGPTEDRNGAADGDIDPVPLDDQRRAAAHRMMRQLADQGLRVLAVAQTTLHTAESSTDDATQSAEEPCTAMSADVVADLVHDLTLLGFLAIADAPRPGAADAVKRLTDAGVRVVMITGDHPATAAAIARDLGIPHTQTILTGTDIDSLTAADRTTVIDQASLFARVSPEHKVRIVQALRQAGHVVAMAGDGVNDAAAIRLADIGIGLAAHGSTAARAAADLVLTDPDLTRILDALYEGRALWASVRDAVAILVGGNAGEVAFTILGTALAGRAPLGTRQLLLVNLLTDMLPALAVALAHRTTAANTAAMNQPAPALMGPALARLLAIRGTATTLAATAAWQTGRLTGRARRADTMGLAALITAQLGQTLITDWRSPLVLTTTALSTTALLTVVQTPGLSHFFGCTPLGPIAWATVATTATTATLTAAAAPRLLTHISVQHPAHHNSEPPTIPLDDGQTLAPGRSPAFERAEG